MTRRLVNNSAHKNCKRIEDVNEEYLLFGGVMMILFLSWPVNFHPKDRLAFSFLTGWMPMITT